VPGSLVFTNTGGHADCDYASLDDALYEPKARAKDSDGDFGEYGLGSVRIANVPPAVVLGSPMNGGTYLGFVSGSGSFTDPGTRDVIVSCTFFWGDVTNTTAVLTQSGGKGRATASHSFAAGGTFQAFLRCVDDDGGGGNSATNTYTVRK
jgi:hypothetical protein